MNVELSETDWKNARMLDAKIKGTGLMETPNYTGLNAKDRFVIGYLGEYGFRRILERAGIRFDHKIVANGKSSRKSEFSVYSKGARFSLEVKTASDPTHRNFMFPEKQRWQTSDLYVGMQLLSPSEAVCHGFLTGEQVKLLPTGTFPPYTVPTVFCPWESLTPVGLHEKVR